MACDPLFTDRFAFPREVFNRPGLARIGYRIGAYPDFVEAMVRRIDAAPELAAWTHRGADDPGIAILEGAAIVGDILTFYQELYANEAYLRTAAWRDSVADLVRLVGYRLAPGIGGRATFAFDVAKTVELPAGYAVKADLDGAAAAADFELDAPLTAYAHLSKARLYRALARAPHIAAGATAIELASVDGSDSAAAFAALALKAGDRLMMMPDEAVWTTHGTPYAAQAAPQVVTVKSVRRIVDRTVVELDAGPAAAWASPARAWRVGRTFRHFGHNAPAQVATLETDASGVVSGTKLAATRFERYLYHDPSTHGYEGADYTSLSKTEMPFDVEAADLAAGVTLLCQGRVRFDGQATPVPFAVARRVAGIGAATVTWGNLNGASTIVRIDGPLIPNPSIVTEIGDIRSMRFHETTSPALTLRPVAAGASGAFASGAGALDFHGTAAEAAAFAGRRLWWVHADGRSLACTCTNAAADFAATGPDVARRWTLSFDRSLHPFVADDFDETAPTVDVHGNVGDASQGKTEREAVIGNGDARAAYQTFALPKSPLTHFAASDENPPAAPELEVRVAGRAWTRVASLYGTGADDEVYVVREASDGRSHVQFGDGVTGARLPSGIGNVTAAYRTGTGAHGAMKPGATPSAGSRIDGLRSVALAGIVSGGADPEPADVARRAAPGRVQSLGRLVSIADHETETLAIPGVVAATAAWGLAAGVPAVLLRVLLEAGREAEFADVRATIAHAQRCRGPDRHAVVVEQAWPRHVWVDVAYARDPARRADDVDAAVRAAVGVAGDTATDRSGVFGLHARRLGEPEYATRIEGRVQQVDGVVWCRVTAFGRLAPRAADPAALALPPAPRPRLARVPCAPGELLQLSAAHLTLVEAAPPPAGDCA